MTFLNPKKNSEANEEEITPSPYQTSMVWAMESFFIEVYSLLVHRIKGIGLSLSDFWQWDTWTTSKLYCMELELIEAEEKELNKDKEEIHDSEEMKDLYEELWGDDS